MFDARSRMRRGGRRVACCWMRSRPASQQQIRRAARRHQTDILAYPVAYLLNQKPPIPWRQRHNRHTVRDLSHGRAWLSLSSSFAIMLDRRGDLHRIRRDNLDNEARRLRCHETGASSRITGHRFQSLTARTLAAGLRLLSRISASRRGLAGAYALRSHQIIAARREVAGARPIRLRFDELRPIVRVRREPANLKNLSPRAGCATTACGGLP